MVRLGWGEPPLRLEYWPRAGSKSVLALALGSVLKLEQSYHFSQDEMTYLVEERTCR